ncbi:MAG: hypothetical protein HY718_21540, partial [Planctomycetes bacterium]|nr:hypothetical protein [Planctomycetota bacterium]
MMNLLYGPQNWVSTGIAPNSRLIPRHPPNRLPAAMIRCGLILALLVAGCAPTPDERCCQDVETALRNGELAAALQLVDHCRQQNPTALEPRRLRVIVLLRLDDLEQVAAALRTLPADDPVLRTALRRREPAVRIGAARLLADQPT